MGYWEGNLKALRKNHPVLWKHLDQLHKEEKRESQIHFITNSSKSGNLYTIMKKDEEEFRLNSPYRPEEEALRWIKQFSWENGSFIRMFGFGNGYFLNALITKLKNEDRLLVIEPSIEILEYALENFELSSILEDERIEIYLWNEMYLELQSALDKHVNWMMLKRRVFCEHPQYDKIFKDEYADYLRVQRSIDMSALLDRNTEIKLGKNSVTNTLNNLKYIKGSALLNDYAGKLPDNVPVIIVAAGPSLDKNVELLKQAKGHALILACDSAQRTLAKHEIIPDAVVTIDPRKALWHFKNCNFEELPLFTTLVSNRKVLELNYGKKIWYCDGMLERELFLRAGLYLPAVGSTGGCVATTAFYLAERMGCKRIILIGQDLAYEGDISHTGGRVSPFKDTSARHVPGNNGDMVVSRYDWIAYLDWYENMIRRKKNSLSVVNATEGGAKIEGTEYIPLQEAIDKYCKSEFDSKQFFYETPSSITEAVFEKMIDSLGDMIEEVGDVKKDAKQAVKYCNDCILDFKLKNRVTSTAVSTSKKIMDLNKKIMHSKLYELLEWLFCSECVETVQELNDFYYTEEEAEVLGSYVNSKKIFESVMKAADTLAEMMSGVKEEFLQQKQETALSANERKETVENV